MLPGLSAEAEQGMRAVLTQTVTSATAERYNDGNYLMLTGRDAESHALGVRLSSGPELTVVVTDATRPVGAVNVITGGAGNLLFIDNRHAQGGLHANIRILGSDCAAVFNDIGAAGYVALQDVFMRGSRQFLFWGEGATAVSCNIEIEGAQAGVAIGDDALISNGVWIRNYNMHALHDLRTGQSIGRPPVTTVLERHVWLGQDALLLGCERIGTGTVVGARALVNRPLPACVVAAGTPAMVLRDGASWGRDSYAMTNAERIAVGWPDLPQA